MPEYLAPGVYVEETSFRSKSIEGVSTTTTGFIGPTRTGPLGMEPDIITSLGEFERVYGDGEQLRFSDAGPIHNFTWHGARAFFEEGGRRLYVVRTFRPAGGLAGDGHAQQEVPVGGGANALLVRARWPGAAGNWRVRITARLGQNVFGGVPGAPTVGALVDNDIVWVSDQGSPLGSPIGPGAPFRVASSFDAATQTRRWRFFDRNNQARELTDFYPDPDPALSDQIRVVTLAVTVFPNDPNGLPQVWNDLSPDPNHRQFGVGVPDALTAVFAAEPINRSQARTLPLVIAIGAGLRTGLDVLNALNVATGGQLFTALARADSTELDRSFDFVLEGGDDGARPGAAEYEGEAPEDRDFKTGLKAFEDIEDVSIIAAPGSTFGMERGYRTEATAITGLLISHAERMRYRIAVLDSGDAQTIADVRAMRARLDSKYAALYYPWVRILDPITRTEIAAPPSGFVAGIYARNDINRAVYKAPANEVVNLALGFEIMLNKSQQDVLNPEGINCFRFFEGRGMRLWGARTISSDPEWKYVNLRRYFIYVERSIDRGTQWVVFEPNGEALWSNVRRTVEDFLFNEWQNGALLGDKPEKAYFVRCDRSTMTQNDLDNGRLVCLIGIAPLRPAEFVIFRIGQWTADAKR